MKAFPVLGSYIKVVLNLRNFFIFNTPRVNKF
jgi:hypothetical protein